jgi:hypothetical protein
MQRGMGGEVTLEKVLIYVIGVATGMCITGILVLWYQVLVLPNYRQAYEDLHTGKIEQVVKQRYPDLWIKFNVSDPLHQDSNRRQQ